MTDALQTIPIAIEPNRLSLRHGEPGRIDITLLNQTSDWDFVHLTISGVPVEWVVLQHQPVKLAPMSMETVPVRINVPRFAEHATGDHVLVVRASSERILSRRGFASITWTMDKRPASVVPLASTSALASDAAAGRAVPRSRRTRHKKSWFTARNRSIMLAMLLLAVVLLGRNQGGQLSSALPEPFDLSPDVAPAQIAESPGSPVAAAPSATTSSSVESVPTAGENATPLQQAASATDQPAPIVASDQVAVEGTVASSQGADPAPTGGITSAPPVQPSPPNSGTEQSPVEEAPSPPAEETSSDTVASAPPVAPTDAPEPEPTSPQPPAATTPDPAPSGEMPASNPPAPPAPTSPPTTEPTRIPDPTSAPDPTATPDIVEAVPLAAPAGTGVNASCDDAGPCPATIFWRDTSDSEEGFKVYGRHGRGSGPGSYDLIATLPPNSTSFDHEPGSGNNRGWCYYVVAVDSETGDSPPSPVMCVNGK